ncbi:conserved hypothetical protein [Streptomyces scabiei 87.22]|uniref:Uncharacterized protein n=1 Tax=Streptomyces scabiei (strain 87.22) TaxID=680198 RepID=C9Z598_STRSW|nr:conserved hypothetical protein [Streptomyces scabiei 87.22]
MDDALSHAAILARPVTTPSGCVVGCGWVGAGRAVPRAPEKAGAAPRAFQARRGPCLSGARGTAREAPRTRTRQPTRPRTHKERGPVTPR